MRHPLIASILAAALLFSPLASAPARADNQDLARILGGVATVVILGAIIKDQRDKNKDSARTVTRHGRPGWRENEWRQNDPNYNRHYRQPAYRQPAYRQPAYRQPPHRQPQYHQPKYHQPARYVPAACLRQIGGRRTVTYYAQPCLRHQMRNANQLPGACAFPLRSLGITGYDPGCLSRHGWRRG